MLQNHFIHSMAIYILLQRNEHSHSLVAKTIRSMGYLICTDKVLCFFVASKSECIACPVESWHFFLWGKKPLHFCYDHHSMSTIVIYMLESTSHLLHEHRWRCALQESNDICIYIYFALLLSHVWYFNKN